MKTLLCMALLLASSSAYAQFAAYKGPVKYKEVRTRVIHLPENGPVHEQRSASTPAESTDLLTTSIVCNQPLASCPLGVP